jgi:hypothetical protein
MSAKAMLAAVLLLPWSGVEAATQYGLWDPGSRSATLRTPYLDPAEGTAANPLSLDDCTWRESITGCPSGPLVYRQSNHWTQDPGHCGVGTGCGKDGRPECARSALSGAR